MECGQYHSLALSDDHRLGREGGGREGGREGGGEGGGGEKRVREG